ncbi:MAG: hypothetical protein ABIJ59_06745 [Pseudomonadota bacterium]
MIKKNNIEKSHVLNQGCRNSKINTLVLRYIISILIISICFIFSLFADQNDKAIDVDIMVLSNPNESKMKGVKILDSGSFFLNKKSRFKIMASIDTVMENWEIVSNQEELQIVQSDILCIEPPCKKKWEFDLSEKKINLSEFPYLELLWNQDVDGNTPTIDVSMAYEQMFDGDKQNSAVLSGQQKESFYIKGLDNNKIQTNMIEADTIDFRDVKFVKRSKVYLAKRVLGLKEDHRWRHTIDGGTLVLQARVDIPLSECSALKIYHKAGFEPLRVSFSLDTDGDLKRDLVILWEQLDKLRYVENNQQVLEIDFSNALEKAGVNFQNGYLLEPIIFVFSDIDTFKNDMPLEKIVFGNVDSNSQVNIVSKNNILIKFEKSIRLKQKEDYKIKKIVITADFDFPQHFVWEKIRFFNLTSRLIPSILTQKKIIESEWNVGVPVESETIIDKISGKYDLSTLEWWSYKNGINFVPESAGIKYTTDKNEVYLYKHFPDQDRWSFTISEKAFLKPVSFNVENVVPIGCTGELIIDGETIDITKNHFDNGVIDLTRFSSIKTISFVIKSNNNKKIYKSETPKINVIGTKNSVYDDLSKMLVKIDKKIIPIKTFGAVNEKNFQVYLEEVELDKGPHLIEVVNSKYFSFNSLLLETESFLFGETQISEEKNNKSLWIPKLLMLCAKLIGFLGFVFTIYILRMRIFVFLNAIWRFIDKHCLNFYRKISEKWLLLFWLTIGVGLNIFSLFSNTNDWLSTTGSISISISLWYLSILAKKYLTFRFPFLGEHIYKNSTTQVFALAFLLIIPTILLSILNLEPVAEQVVAIIFCFFIAGVFGQIYSSIKAS